DCPLLVRPLVEFEPRESGLVVDALYGTGFRGTLAGGADRARERLQGVGAVCVAVDLPSGLNGDSGAGEKVIAADLTVTFARKKPCHLLFPGRALCGEIVVADIGIPAAMIEAAVTGEPATVENDPARWAGLL